MSDEKFTGGLIPGQGPAPPVKVGEPSGNTWTNTDSAGRLVPIAEWAYKAGIAPPLDPAAAIELAKVQAVQAAQERKVQTEVARAEVRRYADEVDKAVKAAAAIKPGPPAPFHHRKLARQLLHDLPAVHVWPGQQEPTLEAIAILQSHGAEMSSGTFVGSLDEAARFELDIAESKAWSAMVARAHIVAGD